MPILVCYSSLWKITITETEDDARREGGIQPVISLNGGGYQLSVVPLRMSLSNGSEEIFDFVNISVC
ncbi:MAG: hypothetical protein ACTS73_06735 [Arsenophonus sp. NEOnobi-MAG3]